MALPSTGSLSLSQVNTELGRAAGATISLGDADVRGLAGVGTGAIGLGALRGKSSQFTHTISSHQQELDLHSYLQAQGWDGVSAATVTIASGVYIWSDNTSVPALDMGGAFPGGLTLINNGFIMGKGGKGGDMDLSNSTYGNGAAGGPAIALTGPISINNAYGYIGGGGGGGAGHSYLGLATNAGAGGGGAGGGEGGTQTENTNTNGVMSAVPPDPPAVGQVGSQNSAIAPNYTSLFQYPATHGGAGGAPSVRSIHRFNI